MKKKLAIIGTVALLGVGAVALSNQEWRANTIFATARDKQLAWLKEHEKEIVKWMHSTYPKVETVQFDWSTLRVGPVSNGVANVEYNLSVSIPNMSGIRMNQPPRISRGKVLEIYE